MDHYIELIEEKISSVRGQRLYCFQVLDAGHLQPWESKEYSNLVEQYEQEIAELTQRLEMVKGYE